MKEILVSLLLLLSLLFITSCEEEISIPSRERLDNAVITINGKNRSTVENETIYIIFNSDSTSLEYVSNLDNGTINEINVQTNENVISVEKDSSTILTLEDGKVEGQLGSITTEPGTMCTINDKSHYTEPIKKFKGKVYLGQTDSIAGRLSFKEDIVIYDYFSFNTPPENLETAKPNKGSWASRYNSVLLLDDMIVLTGDGSIMCDAEYGKQPSMDDTIIFTISSNTKLKSTLDNLELTLK